VDTVPNYWDGNYTIHAAVVLCYETKNLYNWKWAYYGGSSYDNKSPFVDYTNDLGKYLPNKAYYPYLKQYQQQCNAYYQPQATTTTATYAPTTTTYYTTTTSSSTYYTTTSTYYPTTSTYYPTTTTSVYYPTTTTKATTTYYY